MFLNIEKLTTKNENSFNLLRLLAAVGVVITHSYSLTGRPENDWLAIISHGQLSFSRLGVYIFFIISGFLITQSLERSSSLFSFYWKRFLRIFPALFIVLFLTVFVFGPFLTNLNWGEYFKSYGTYRYLGGLTLYRLIYNLPGVFLNNIYPTAINGSLWTLPYEWTCYVFISLFFIFLKRGKKVFILVSFLFLILLRFGFSTELANRNIPVLLLNASQLLNFLILFFSGAVAYIYRNYIKLSSYFALLLLALSYFSFFSSYSIFVLYFTLTYLILYLAVLPLPFRNIFLERDFSYGLYIYAFPVQQFLASIFRDQISILSMATMSFFLTLPFAVISWYFIEKPSLKFKKIKLSS